MANLCAMEIELLRPSVLKEGHLLKLGRSLKLPKLNYYVLRPSGVYCFEGKRELASTPYAFIPLEEISVSLGTVVELANSPLHCIKIADKRKVHILACHSIEIRDSWITAILTAVAQRLVSTPPPLRRKRIGSMPGLFSDSEVFREVHECREFTSPFWTCQEGQKRTSKWSRLSRGMSVSRGGSEKTGISIRNRKKKGLSKSASLGDIHSMFKEAQSQPNLTRKRSTNDITRHIFWANTDPKQMANNDVFEDTKKTTHGSHVPTKANGKKRWSFFGMASSLGLPLWDNNSERRQDFETKQRDTAYKERGSPLICDTKF